MLIAHDLVKIEYEVDQIIESLSQEFDVLYDDTDHFLLLKRLEDLEGQVNHSYKECIKQRLRIVN